MSYSEDEGQQQEQKEEQPVEKEKKTKSLEDYSTSIKKEKAFNFTIGQNSSGKRIVQISKFKGKVRIDIREYYNDDDEWKPTKKGVSLDLKQWQKLQSFTNLINEAIEELED